MRAGTEDMTSPSGYRTEEDPLLNLDWTPVGSLYGVPCHLILPSLQIKSKPSPCCDTNLKTHEDEHECLVTEHVESCWKVEEDEDWRQFGWSKSMKLLSKGHKSILKIDLFWFIIYSGWDRDNCSLILKERCDTVILLVDADVWVIYCGVFRMDLTITVRCSGH